jgi:hypothetical protein
MQNYERRVKAKKRRGNKKGTNFFDFGESVDGFWRRGVCGDG